MTAHLSTLTLHRYRYGELSEGREAEVRAHLDGCDRCATLLRAQENQRAAFELQPVPEAIRQVGSDDRPGIQWPRWLLAGLALAAALLLGIVLLPDALEPPGEVIRVKGGGADVEVWIDTPDGPASQAEFGPARAGDRIQVRFRRPSASWVSLAGVDTRGEIEVYGTWTADMDTNDWQLAPFALELDDAPGDQDLALLFTPDRPTASAVRTAVDAGRAPPGGEIRWIEVEKGP